jgi:hypothetical protein
MAFETPSEIASDAYGLPVADSIRVPPGAEFYEAGDRVRDALDGAQAAAGAPIIARNAGSTAVAISCPQSLRRLVTPMPTTFRFNQRSRPAQGRQQLKSTSFMASSKRPRPGVPRAERRCRADGGLITCGRQRM